MRNAELFGLHSRKNLQPCKRWASQLSGWFERLNWLELPGLQEEKETYQFVFCLAWDLLNKRAAKTAGAGPLHSMSYSTMVGYKKVQWYEVK